MNKYLYRVAFLLIMTFISCDNANDLLNQYIEDGPIVYAAKVDELKTQSGFYRFKVNIYPYIDVNRSYCVVSWNITGEVSDSVRIDYTENNFDQDSLCYFTYIDISPEDDLQGNLQVYAYNVDIFGNKSLTEMASAFIYGDNYVASLLNAQVSFSSQIDQVIFEPRVGAIGNLLSYEQNNGSFTQEFFVSQNSYPLIDAKRGGIIRTKTRYLINETDIDTLDVTEYLETRIP